jgi:hypothetical protein
VTFTTGRYPKHYWVVAELTREKARIAGLFETGGSVFQLEAWPTRGVARARLRRAIGHALEFRTWHSLVRRQGCRTDEAARLMLTFVRAAASDEVGAKKESRS